MAKRDNTQLPSSQGGLIGYTGAGGSSKIQIPPGMIVIVVTVVVVVALLLQFFVLN